MAILATQRVLTLDYWKLANDITESDIVFDRHGKPVRVKLVQKYRSEDCYAVYFDDGLSIKGDLNLKLPLENEKYRKRTYEYKGQKKFKRPVSVKSLETLRDLPLRVRGKIHEYTVPTAGALQLPTQELPVPPFVFGFWFFNKNPDDIMVPPDGYAEFVHRKFKDAGYKIIKKNKTTHGRYRFITKPTVRSHLVPKVPTSIPENYLLASVEQRLDLLRGIIHSRSRQYNERQDRFRITLLNELAIKQIQWLAESLGCKTTLRYDKYLKNFVLRIKTKLRLIENQLSPNIKIRQQWRYVNEIVPIEAQNCVHIETDGPDGSFLVGEGFIACH
jgi:hypothetical protein